MPTTPKPKPARKAETKPEDPITNKQAVDAPLLRDNDDKRTPEDDDDTEESKPRAGLPILSVGSSDPIVPELFAKLAELGYDTPTSRGENPHAVVGSEELQAARQFRRDNDVEDDADAFAHGEADQHIGPWTIEAILSA